MLIAFLYTRDQTLASVAFNNPKICHSNQNLLKFRPKFLAHVDKRLYIATINRNALLKMKPEDSE